MSYSYSSSTVSVDHNRRFGGIDRLYGTAGATQIAQAHVIVVGIGGVGSWAAEALARSAVGHITLVDMDHVAESNINRQLHATDATLGQAKVEAMRTRITSYHPNCVVQVIDDFLTPENCADILSATPYCAVIDACDQRSAKLAIANWVLAQPTARRPLLVTAGAAGGKRLGHLVEVADLSNVTHDPLLARLRQQIRKQQRLQLQTLPLSAKPTPSNTPSTPTTNRTHSNNKMGITCVFSREPVHHPTNTIQSCDLVSPAIPTAPTTGLNCHGYGSAVSVTAVFGLCAAGWVLDQLACQGEAAISAAPSVPAHTVSPSI